MPKSKTEELIFSCLMVGVMVYFITVYNAVLENGRLFTAFPNALLTMWPEAALAFIVQRYIGGPLSLKLAPRMAALFPVTARRVATVIVMAPCMTLLVSLMHHGATVHLPALWLTSLGRNFFFALCLQLFLAGPLVVALSQRIFAMLREED